MLARSEFVPIFKYLREAGYLDKKATDVQNLDARVQKGMKIARTAFYPPKQYQKKMKSIQQNKYTVSTLSKDFDVKHSVLLIPLIDPALLKPQDILRFMKSNSEIFDKKGSQLTNARKLACLYDYLKYGPDDENRT